MYHAACWENYVSHSVDEEYMHCPNCRGPGRMIAVWPFIDADLVTQRDPQNESEQVPNQMSDSSGRQEADAAAEQARSSYFSEDALGYHIRTQLPDGRPSLIIDPGSVGNLCGDRWAKTVAQAAARSGRTPSYEKRSKPLNVSGVGHGSQAAPFDCKLPISLKHNDSHAVSSGTVTTPAVANSDLPGLLGLTALRKNKAIIDFSTLTMYFTGPGNYDLNKSLPPGTDCFQCELAPSGHMVIPCCEYDNQSSQRGDTELTLVTRQREGQSREASPPGLAHFQ